MFKKGDTVMQDVSPFYRGVVTKTNEGSIYVLWDHLTIDRMPRQILRDSLLYGRIVLPHRCANCDRGAPQNDYLCEECRV